MATGELSESALTSSIDSSKKKKLEILATGGEAGLAALDEADTRGKAIEEATKRDITRLVGKDNAAAVAELQANREALLAGVSSAAELGRQGFTEQSKRLEKNVEDYANVFQSQAPEYARIERQYRSEAAARRLAAAKAAQLKAFKASRAAARDAAEFGRGFEGFKDKTQTQAVEDRLNEMPPVVADTIRELINPASPLQGNPITLDYIFNTSNPYNVQAEQFFALAIQQMDSNVSPSIVIEELRNLRQTISLSNSNSTNTTQQNDEEEEINPYAGE